MMDLQTQCWTNHKHFILTSFANKEFTFWLLCTDTILNTQVFFFSRINSVNGSRTRTFLKPREQLCSIFFFHFARIQSCSWQETVRVKWRCAPSNLGRILWEGSELLPLHCEKLPALWPPHYISCTYRQGPTLFSRRPPASSWIFTIFLRLCTGISMTTLSNQNPSQRLITDPHPPIITA